MRQGAFVWILAAAAIVAAGCGTGDRPSATSDTGNGTPTEAAETERLDSRAKDFEARYREIREGEGSEQEKAAAVSRLADEQQRALREAADGTPSADDDGEGNGDR